MAATNLDRVLAYLRSIAPLGATNAEISKATGITPHQQVFMKTQELKEDGLIQGRQQGRTWTFYAGKATLQQSKSPEKSLARKQLPQSGKLSPSGFEALSQRVMSRHFGKHLAPGEAHGMPKRFDFVSADGKTVGDAKYYTIVQGKRLPPAKFSVIAEHVWLSEKTNARHCFLVFGNDIRVPQQWLARYGKLVEKVKFYFLEDGGRLEKLT